MMTQNQPLNLVWKVSPSLVAYPEALAYMERHVQGMQQDEKGEEIWLLEHPPLYTAGTSANKTDLKDPGRFPVYDAGRGGQYTYHGPGQRVAYVMLDLRARGKDVRSFVFNLEQVMIDAIASFGITAERRQGRVGVWVAHPNGREEKIAAIGVRVKRWITYHGLAINVDPDLDHFTGIVPCGIQQHGVTSLAALKPGITMAELDLALYKSFEAIFGFEKRPLPAIPAYPDTDAALPKTLSTKPEDTFAAIRQTVPKPQDDRNDPDDPVAAAHDSFV